MLDETGEMQLSVCAALWARSVEGQVKTSEVKGIEWL